MIDARNPRIVSVVCEDASNVCFTLENHPHPVYAKDYEPGTEMYGRLTLVAQSLLDALRNANSEFGAYSI